MPSETELLPPRYRAPRPIARGAVGDVYRATDTTLGRIVAVKLLSGRYAEAGAVQERFTREALAAARLSSAPNVVTIFDVGEWNGRPFIVMEHLGGGSLHDRLEREGAQSPGRALRWLEQAGRALDTAHADGIVHRDVKPANLLLDRSDNVHVADFGIASATGMDSLTQTGTVLGTAGYLSPEQARGERVGPASDRYSLAVVAFELLTGGRPFAAESPTAEAAAHVHRAVPSSCERRSDLPCELDPVFERGLAKDPRERYGSCVELVAELRGAFDDAAGRTEAAAPQVPVTALTRVVPPRRRRRNRSPFVPLVAAIAALAAIAGGIAAAVVSGGGSGHHASQPQTVIRTVTQPGTTQTVQVTTTSPATTRPAATSSPPSNESGASLNDRGFALMRQGDYASALPLLERSVSALDGTGSLNEAYAKYNLAYTRLQLGSCNSVDDLLRESESIQGHRHEIDDARKQAKKQCR